MSIMAKVTKGGRVLRTVNYFYYYKKMYQYNGGGQLRLNTINTDYRSKPTAHA